MPEANQTHKRVKPLKGQTNFVQLMRGRPLASWQSNKVYASLASNQSDVEPTTTNTRILLGQIVPKKLFPLAVDRNRVRRLARAQAQALVATICPTETIQMLLKLSPVKKMPGASKNSVSSPVQNPHSRVFSNALRASMTQAVQRINTELAQKTVAP
jgi:ribonuclease P protein component